MVVEQFLHYHTKLTVLTEFCIHSYNTSKVDNYRTYFERFKDFQLQVICHTIFDFWGDAYDPYLQMVLYSKSKPL